MKFKNLIGAGVLFGAAAIMAGTIVVSSTQKNQDNKSAQSVTEAGLTAGVTQSLNVKDMESINVTAGVSDVLMDMTDVAVTDTGLHTVTASMEQVASDQKENNTNTKNIAETCGYTNLGIAQVDGSLNVRKGAGTDSKVVGKMSNHDACEILGKKDGWIKIKSGKVKGYVKSGYLLMGDAALTIAEKEVETVATVNTTTLRVREDKSTDSAIVSLVGEGEDLIVEKIVDDWYKVEVDDQKGYISGEYVTISQKLPTASSVEELENGTGVSDTRVSLVQYALQFVGNRYVWGGTSLTNGIDCSGFTMQIYARYGISLPHHAASQPGYGTRISASDAQPGDLFFYGSGSTISHVGIYIGNGQIVHASNARTGIKISSAYYRTPICVARYLK
uniref:C40 family peptidase n=1 Tax=Agathobacter sp. TaxID=2021311 RepID=UPI0040293C79